ncbi:MAG: CinA family protein [Candidatus Sulfobium sp.]|jgi:nicotinamide-nucleotide amidase
MDSDLLTAVKKVAARLTENDLRLSIAESCTGGFISNAITNLPGSSKFYEMSVVSYSARAKRSVLGISSSLLKKHGTVSEETAVAMARSARELGGSEVALSVTGVAGPETVEDREVGLVYMAVAIEDLVKSKGVKLTGDREEIKLAASLDALRFLDQTLRLWL